MRRQAPTGRRVGRKHMLGGACALAATLWTAGCAQRPTLPDAVTGPSLGEQLRRQDEALVGQRFRTLLDFEKQTDATFVTPGGVAAAVPHTGASGLACVSTATVNVSSLMFGLKLPAEFTLAGGYVRPTAGTMSVALIADGRELARTIRRVPPGTWAVAAVDLTTLADPAALGRASSIRLVFASSGKFDLDDVMLINNRRTLVGVPGGWTIRQCGLSVTIDRPNERPESYRTLASGDDGWAVEETSPLRVRLYKVRRSTFRTLLPDGRCIENGRATNGHPGDTPARIVVDESTARLDRESPGDVDNDGYNDRRAAFQLLARTPRPQFTLLTHGGQSALVEIRNVAPGNPVVTANGLLIDYVSRPTADSLLIKVPLAPGPAVEVTVGVRRD